MRHVARHSATNRELLGRLGLQTMSTCPARRQLQWLGSVWRMAVTKAFTRQDVLKHHVTNPCNDRRVRLTKHANYCALLMPILRRTRQLSAPQYLMISRCVFLSCKRGTLKAFGPTQVTDAQGQCCPRCKSNAHVTYKDFRIRKIWGFNA